MKISFFTTVLLTTSVMLTACGMEPSGGRSNPASNPSSKNPVEEKEEAEAKTPTPESADALRSGVAQLPESYEEINTAEVAACHATGKIFNRRTLKCSKTISLATSFACNKTGIADGFIYTGYQINEVLSTAESDGFVIDQCGETDDKKRLVFFIRADNDGSYSVREIETSIN